MFDSCKMLQKQSEAFHTFLWHFFSKFKQNFIAYRSSKVSDCISKIHQLLQSGFSRVYSNSCYCCSFESEIIKIGQSCHKMYSNNILNFQESTTILNACTKKAGNLLTAPSIYIYIYIHIQGKVVLTQNPFPNFSENIRKISITLFLNLISS